MTDQNPTPEPNTNPGEIANELRQLGENLRQALQNAWDSQERKKFQQEIEGGLAELGSTLSQAAKDFADGPTGQTLKADIDDFGQRLRTGEIENKVRSEVLGALRTANQELKKATQSKQPSAGTPPQEPPAATD